MTLAELGRQAGTGVRFLSEFERGKETAEIGKVLRVLAALGVSLAPAGAGSSSRIPPAPPSVEPATRDDAGRLQDMQRAARELEAMFRDHPVFIPEGVPRRALERSIELLGEAARRVSAATRARLPALPWRMLVGWRNALVMNYDTVDHAALVASVRAELPGLLPRLVPADDGGGRDAGPRDQ